MDLDIVRKIKIEPLKASFENLAFKYRIALIISLLSIITSTLPHEAFGHETQITINPNAVLVFDTSDLSYLDYLDSVSQQLAKQHRQETLKQLALRKLELTKKVKEYLQQQRSPLADYSAVLVAVKNWKKIVALANAESTLCRTYPTTKANCWGVGGANLWDMGDNLGDGIISMNKFLNNYPLKSSTKYATMSFERMNGFYKQPAADHWLYNVQSVYDDLTAIENSI